jgi:hypothetical protein
MRRLGYGLGLLLLATFVALVVWRFGAMPLPAFLTAEANPGKLSLVPQSSISMSYLLNDKEWLSFPLTPGSTQIKLISNANSDNFELARKQRLADPNRRWSYAVEIDAIDRWGKTLFKRTHYHRTDTAEFRSPDGQLYTPSFYLRENLTPLSGTVLTLDLAGFPQVSTLRLRLAHKDPDIADVVVRAYQPDRNSEQRAAFLWQRLSEKQKEALARGNVYPHELLLEHEKRNLLLHSWTAVGPKGAEGRDYQSRELYVLLDNDGEIVDNAIPPSGVIADHQIWGTVPIPEEGGTLRLMLQPTHSTTPPEFPQNPDATAAATQYPVKLRWYGATLFERNETRITTLQAQQGYTMKVEGGLLEAEAPIEMAMRAFLRRNGTAPGAVEEEITPPVQYLRTIVADEENPVSYTLDTQREPSLFRVEIRHLRTGTLPLRINAHYAILDADGRFLKQGEIPLALPDSHYERIIGDYSGARLTDPGTFFFALPSNARQIRFWPGHDGSSRQEKAPPSPPLLISAHNRPVGLAREIRVPDDSFDFDAGGKRIPAWFPLRPDQYESSVLNNRSRVVALQARPSEEKADIVAGNYQWEDYRPNGNWLARPIYTPREKGAPFREDILPTTFTPLAAGHPLVLDFPAYQGTTVLTPTLVWIGGKAAVTLQIQVDDAPPLTIRAYGPYAETALPPLPAGRHRIRITASDKGSLYINHVRPGAGAAPLTRRLAQRFSGNLSFDYERTSDSEEALTIRLFQPSSPDSGSPAADQNHRSNLSVSITAPRTPEMTPLQGWVFNERQATVRPDKRFSAPIFGTAGRHSDAGQPIFIPFSADAPKGKYRIVVQSRDGAGGYLTVSRMGPAIAAQRRAHTQPEIRHAEIVE